MRKEAEDKNDNQNEGMLDAISRVTEEAHRPKGMLDSILATTEAAERQRQEEEARPKGMLDSIVATTEAAQSGQAGASESGLSGQSGGVSSSAGGYSTSDTNMSTASPSFDELYPPYTGDNDEEFVGSGGVGSAEHMEAMRRGHEERGTGFQSDQRSAGEIEHG